MACHVASFQSPAFRVGSDCLLDSKKASRFVLCSPEGAPSSEILSAEGPIRSARGARRRALALFRRLGTDRYDRCRVTFVNLLYGYLSESSRRRAAVGGRDHGEPPQPPHDLRPGKPGCSAAAMGGALGVNAGAPQGGISLYAVYEGFPFTRQFPL